MQRISYREKGKDLHSNEVADGVAVVRHENRLQEPPIAHAAAHTTTTCVITSDGQGAKLLLFH